MQNNSKISYKNLCKIISEKKRQIVIIETICNININMKLILILILLLTTFNLTSSQKNVKAAKSNISLVKGKYILDTFAILNNNNLEKLIEELEQTELIEKQKVNEIPTFIMKLLKSLNEDFSIVGVGEEYTSGCTSVRYHTQIKKYDKKTGDTIIQNKFGAPIPRRQLTYLGFSDNIALMTFYTGGFSKIQHIIIIKYKKTNIMDFWCGHSSVDIWTKNETLNYLKEKRLIEGGLNSNFIYF